VSTTIRYIALIALLVYLITLHPSAWGIILMLAVLVFNIVPDVLNRRNRKRREA
jgi:hypothetical protein